MKVVRVAVAAFVMLVPMALPAAAGDGPCGPFPIQHGICPAVAGAVAACEAYGAIVVPGQGTTIPPFADAHAAAAVEAGDATAFDEAGFPTLDLPLGPVQVEVRNLHAACAAEAHDGWDFGYRLAGGYAGAERIFLRYGFGEIVELRALGVIASMSAPVGDPPFEGGRCETAYSSRPDFFGDADLPCPPLDTGAFLPGMRVRFDERWGPGALPGTGLVGYGRAALHVTLGSSEASATHVYVGVVVVAAEPPGL